MIRRWWAIALLTLVSLGAVPLALRVTVDPGTSGWIDAQGPAATALASVEARFGRQDGFLVALSAPDVLTPEAVAWQRTLTSELAALPGVAGVDSLITAQDVVVDEMGPAPAPLLDQERARILGHPIYRDLLVAGNGRSAGLFVRLTDAVDDAASLTLEARITGLLAAHPAPVGGSVVLGGLPVQQHAIGRAVAHDQALTVPLTIALLTVVLVLTVPAWRLVLATLAGVGSALGWTFAGIELAGRPLDALLGLLPPLVLGIGVATALHLIRALSQEAQEAQEAQQKTTEADPNPNRTSASPRLCGSIPAESSRRRALARLRLPLVLATLTALAGVGGLWLGAVPAVRGFAPWAMLAVGLGTLLPVLWLLAVTPLVPTADWTRVATGRWGDRFGARLAALAEAAARRRRTILGVAGVVALAAAGWCFQLRADADFVHALPETDPARIAQETIDRELTGTLGLDLLVDVGHPPTAAEVTRLAALGERIRHDPELSGGTVAQAMSLGDVLALVEAGGDRRPAEELLADLKLGAKPVVARFLGAGLRTGTDLNPSATTLRLMARQHDGSVAQAAAAARRIEAAAVAAFPGATVRVASAALLLDETTARLLPATANGLAASKVAVVVLLLVFLRSWRLALMASILAGLPLLLTYAAIPALGWPLDIGVSMIACIALGIVMNDTVHLVHALHHHGLAGAYRRVGPPVALAGLVLALAFSACDLGSFSYTRRFGVLLTLAFASGLVVNLVLAPALAGLIRTQPENRP